MPRLSYLVPGPLALAVYLHPYATAFHPLPDILRVWDMAIGDGQYLDLNRRQPEWKGPGILLYKDSHVTLKAAQHGAVYHHRGVLPVIRAGVGHLEASGQVEIELNCGALPVAAQRILELDVDLGAVEYPFPLIYDVLERLVLQRLSEQFDRPFPLLDVSHVILRPGAQGNLKLGEAKRALDLKGEPDRVVYLLFRLLHGAEYMSVVLGEAAHP